MTPDQQSTTGTLKANWLLLPLLFSPAILCLIFGVIVRMVPRERTSDVCSAFLSETLITSMSLMRSAIRELVFPCSVLAVQASVVIPVAFLIVILVISLVTPRRKHIRYVGPKLNLFIWLFAVAATYVIWIDLFFVGVLYEMLSPRRPLRPSAPFRWLLGMSFASLFAAALAGGLVAAACRSLQPLTTKWLGGGLPR